MSHESFLKKLTGDSVNEPSISIDTIVLPSVAFQDSWALVNGQPASTQCDDRKPVF